jgi:hypothetical protein
MTLIKPSRLYSGNEREAIELLTRALAGKIGVDDDGFLWLCGVKLGKVKTENGEKTLFTEER